MHVGECEKGMQGDHRLLFSAMEHQRGANLPVSKSGYSLKHQGWANPMQPRPIKAVRATATLDKSPHHTAHG
jgi:hypothetical protein